MSVAAPPPPDQSEFAAAQRALSRHYALDPAVGAAVEASIRTEEKFEGEERYVIRDT